MNLWLSAHLLFAVLFLSSSAPTPEECQKLVTPLSLADPSVIYGKLFFLSGYIDHGTFKALLSVMDSSWVNVTESSSTPSEVVLYQESRMNGTCLAETRNAAIEETIMTTNLPNMTTTFHVLPSCPGCLIFSANTTVKNFKQLIRLMKLGDGNVPDEIDSLAVYLLGRTPNVTDSDLEHFKKQASCLGFSGEPDFVYNPEKSLCKEGEGMKMPYSL